MIYLIGLIIIFVLVLLSFSARSAENKLLKGFWRADAEFCDKAELEMFVLYLGDNIGYVNHCRNGYILAANEQGIILNSPIQMKLSGGTTMSLGLASCKDYAAVIDWQGNEPDAATFPSELRVAYYPNHGKLLLYQGDQVLASLWKDCQMSAVAADVDLLPGCISTNEPESYPDLDNGIDLK